MKVLRIGVMGLFLSVSLLSCFDPPEYPLEPQITFKNISFKDMADPSLSDSLVLEVSFKDGDGNLGLSESERGCYDVGGKQVCYNEAFYFQINTGPFKDQFLNYRIKRTDPENDTLPDYVKPYIYTNWEIIKNNAGVVVDTLYFQLNPDHHNIFVDFLMKRPDGSFEEFNFRNEYGTTYDSRFPVLAKDGAEGPLEGVIRYAMPGIGFQAIFGSVTLKLRIQIQDRDLNKSNIIETPEFTLRSIRG